MLTRFFHRFVAHPRVYDWVQYALGYPITRARLRPYLARMGEGWVLDAGAGTGETASLLPPAARYLWLDSDPRKLRGFRAKTLSSPALLGDAAHIPLRSKSVDHGICLALTHHLPDRALPALFSELARVIRGRLLFLDPVEKKPAMFSGLLWRYDRGSYPRSAQALGEALQGSFEIEHAERYAILHHYWLCLARPKS